MSYKNIRDEIWEKLPPLESLIDTHEFKKTGDGLLGPHPIHGSTTGSNLSINTTEEVWYCFRCQSGGSKFEWIAVSEGFIECDEAGDISNDFPEILKKAAEIAGVELELDPDSRKNWKKFREEEETIKKILRTAQNFFLSKLGREQIKWIKEKYGYSEETIKQFGLGYAPPTNYELTSYLTSHFDKETILKSGLVFKTENGVKDLFQGRITFPYYKNGNLVYFIGRQTPETPEWDKAKYKKQLKKSEKHDYVSEVVQEPLYGVDSIRGKDYLLITEGIADAISAIDNGFPCISPVTVRFKEDHIHELNKYVKGKTVYICNDVEESEAGLEGALNTLEGLHDNSYLVTLPSNGEKVDLNDYFKNNTADDFYGLMKSATQKYDAIADFYGDSISLFKAALKENNVDPKRVRKVWNNKEQKFFFYSLDNIFNNTNGFKGAVSIFRRSEESDFKTPTAVEKPIKTRVIAGAIMRDLLRRGRFLRDMNYNPYYFYTEDKRVYGFNELEPLLANLYNTNSATEEGRFTIKELENYALRYGEEINIYKHFHFDKDEKILYIHDRDTHYFRLDGQNIEVFSNGTNGIYFQSIYDEPIIKYINKEERNIDYEIHGELPYFKNKGNLVHQLLVNRVNFSYNTALNEEQQRLQLLLHIYTLPFYEYLESRPIMCFVGEKGSGKSITLKMIGYFLFGKEFDVSSVPDEKDFYIIASNNPVFFLDNVDKSYDWLQDALATLATGVRLRKRELYTNFKEISRKPQCFVGLTSRNPNFKRDDVVDRMLVFHVERFEQFYSPHTMLQPIEEYSDYAWSDYLDDLNKIIANLKERDINNILTSHRLADWAAFAILIAEALGIDNAETNTLLENMEKERAAFTLQEDPLYSVLTKFVESEINTGAWFSASDLHKILLENFGDKYYYKSSTGLGKKLSNLQSELSSLLGMQRKKDNHKKVWVVKFPTKEEVQDNPLFQDYESRSDDEDDFVEEELDLSGLTGDEG